MSTGISYTIATRNTSGYVSQHNVLWLDLSAREHMLLYAGMKGVPSDRQAEEVNELLKTVQLLDVRQSFFDLATHNSGVLLIP